MCLIAPMASHDTNIYQPDEPGSYFRLGPDTPRLRVVFLHGAGASAENFRAPAEMLAEYLPDAEILVPNGNYKITLDDIPDNYKEEYSAHLEAGPCYWWYTPDAGEGEKGDFITASLDNIEQEEPLPLFLLGFSQGGFYASRLYAQNPDRYDGVVLHSSALVDTPALKQTPQRENRDKGKPAAIYSFIGLKDEHLYRWISPLLLATHFKNSAMLNWRGHKNTTAFKSGFGHEITGRSMDIAAAHIREIMDYRP